MNNNNYAFVDLQGFISNANKFVVKEIAIITSNTKYHDIVKSTPTPFSDLDAAHKKQAKWLTYNFHGLKWSWGYNTIQNLRKQIVPILNQKTVYVKGDQKTEWLEQILSHQKSYVLKIINIEPLNCSLSLSLNNGSTYQKFKICENHTAMKNEERCHCALKNVLVLQNWFQQNRESLESELLENTTM